MKKTLLPRQKVYRRTVHYRPLFTQIVLHGRHPAETDLYRTQNTAKCKHALFCLVYHQDTWEKWSSLIILIILFHASYQLRHKSGREGQGRGVSPKSHNILALTRETWSLEERGIVNLSRIICNLEYPFASHCSFLFLRGVLLFPLSTCVISFFKVLCHAATLFIYFYIYRAYIQYLLYIILVECHS
jgi:hypothetical protein